LLGVALRTLQRWRASPDDDGRKKNRFAIKNQLTPAEREQVISVCCSPLYRDLSPNQIVPRLAEMGQYIASEASFYRILKQAGMLTHRGLARAPQRARPDAITATAPNQVWTWDISYLLTTQRGVYLYLYLIMDIWDRSIVGWAVHDVESGALAAKLLRTSCLEQKVQPGALTVHQDNGAAMISADFLVAVQAWGRASYSRPGVSDDNPFSESLFRTLKYRSWFPQRFAGLDAAVAWVAAFVAWYNEEHRHSAISFVTPGQRRRGEDFAILTVRRETYEKARAAHPERWSGAARHWNRIESVTLNPSERKKNRRIAAA
jgi:hypothetical protein